MGDKLEVGDKAAWNWGGGAPEGVVAQKKTEGEISILSHRGNEIKKKADPENPAIELQRSGNNVVKKQSELEVVEKDAKPDMKQAGGKGGSKESSRPQTPAKEKSANGRSKSSTPANGAGSKRKHEDEEKPEDKKNEQGDKAEKKDEKKPVKEGKEDEKATASTSAGDANSKAKKDDNKTEEANKNGGDPKKKPGRPPKDPNAPPPSKKQKKEHREGTRRSARLKK